MSVLSATEIQARLPELSGWQSEGMFITKTYQLDDFKTALAFVNKIGGIAESQDHHPDILIHGWNKVTLTCSTHSENGVTSKDFQLASAIENVEI